MSEFVGRTGAKRNYSYPENTRAAALLLFARNFATGPKNNPTIGAGGTQIPWNLIDSVEKTFTIPAGGVTVSIAGNVESQFNNGDFVSISPRTPTSLPRETNQIATNPAFNPVTGLTTFDLSGPLSDPSTTGGLIEDPASSTDVPITPRVTGVVLISGVVTVGNTTNAPIAQITVRVQVDGDSLPVPPDGALFGPLPEDGSITIPFLVETTLPIGTMSPIEVIVTGEGATLLAEDSAINIQEVSVATG